MKSNIRVCVVDDHPLFRDGVVFALASHPDLEIVGLGSCAADAVRMARENAPDVIILDMSMPGGGLAAVEQIAEQFPETKTLMLTVVADEEQVSTALRLGARGYLLKGSSGTELAHTIRVLHDGECYVTPALSAKLFSRFGSGATAIVGKSRFASLSPREEQILSNIVKGMSNKEIGNKLALSEKTIKHHVTSILQKLHVRNRVEAAILASDRTADMRPPITSESYRAHP